MMTIFPMLLTLFTLAGARPVPVNCTPGSPGTINGTVDWGITWLDPDNPANDHIDVYGRIGCAAIIWLESTPAERRQLAQLNPGWNWPLIVADGILLDLHEAEHVAIAQQGLLPAGSLGSPTEECLDGRRADDTVAAAVTRLVPKPLWPQVDEEIRRYDQSILDWSPCQQLIGYLGPDPTLPT